MINIFQSADTATAVNKSWDNLARARESEVLQVTWAHTQIAAVGKLFTGI